MGLFVLSTSFPLRESSSATVEGVVRRSEPAFDFAVRTVRRSGFDTR